jgi:hypothetical protein
MRRKILAVVSIVMFAGLLSMAQTRNQQRGGAQPALDPTAVQARTVTLAGSVTAVNLAPGEGMPTITPQSSSSSFCETEGLPRAFSTALRTC